MCEWREKLLRQLRMLLGFLQIRRVQPDVQQPVSVPLGILEPGEELLGFFEQILVA